MGAAPGRTADGATLRDELRLGDDRHVAPGVPRRGGDHRLLLLPDRLPARRRLASGHRSGARGDGPVARARRPADLFPRRVAPASPGAARGTAARGARRARRVRRLRGAEVPDVHPQHLRPVPARLQRLGCRRTVVLLDRAVPLVLLVANRLRGGAELHAASARVSAGGPCVRARAQRRGAGGLALVAVSVGIPVGMLVYWFMQSSQRRPLERHGEPAVPVAGDLDLGPPRRGLGRRGARPRAAGGGARRALPGPSRGCSSGALPVVRTARPRRRRSRSRTRPATMCVSSTAAWSDRVRRGGAVRAVRGGGHAQHPRTDRARDGGLGPLTRARTAADAAAGHAAARATRPGGGAVFVFAFVLGDLSTAQVLLPPRPVHARHRVSGQQLDRGVRGRGALRRRADRARDGRHLRADEPLRGIRARGGTSVAELRCRRSPSPTAPARCWPTSTSSFPRVR